MTPLAIAHAMTMMKCVPENERVVVLSLPPEYFKEYWPKLKERARSFVVNGQEYSFERVSIVPQGVGAFCDFISRNDIDDDEASLLVDIGANTVNMMIAQGEGVIRNIQNNSKSREHVLLARRLSTSCEAKKKSRFLIPKSIKFSVQECTTRS